MNTEEKSLGAVRWNLKRLMDERDIGPTEFARVLKIDISAVTRWRQAKYLPQINEIRWLQIVSAINEICKLRGYRDMLIELKDLVEFRQDEQRDFNIFDYQYPPRSEYKKSKLNGEKKTMAIKK
jgi:DNA-binding Xre family transcriptional regulator